MKETDNDRTKRRSRPLAATQSIGFGTLHTHFSSEPVTLDVRWTGLVQDYMRVVVAISQVWQVLGCYHPTTGYSLVLEVAIGMQRDI
jgi:hypothetical protein